jgi:hypothetical protein
MDKDAEEAIEPARQHDLIKKGTSMARNANEDARIFLGNYASLYDDPTVYERLDALEETNKKLIARLLLLEKTD